MLSLIHKSLASLGILSFLDFMHSQAPGVDGDQSLGNEVAKDEGKGKRPETKDVLIFQPSKVSTCPAMKIGSIVGPPNDLTSPSFSSPVPSSLVRLLLEQDCESTIPMSSLFYI